VTPPKHGWAGLLLVALASCADFRDPPVVTIGSETWTSTDLRRAYAELDARWRTPLADRAAREAFVQRLVERRLLAEYGDSLLAADGRAETHWTTTANEILLRRLRVVVGAGELPTDAEVQEAIARMADRSRVERIQFPDAESARAARARILAGESFADVAAAGLGTLLAEQWIAWRPNGDEVSELVASLPPGEVSEVVRAGFVDQLVRVVERAHVDEAVDESHAEAVRGLQARRADERVKELVGTLRERAGVQIDESVVDALAAETAEAILAASATQHDASWAIPMLDATQEAAIVAHWQGGSLSAREYVAALRLAIPAHRPCGGFLTRQVRAAVEADVDRSLLLAEAVRRGLEADRWVERAMRKGREDFEVRYALDRIAAAVPVTAAAVDSVTKFLESVPVAMLRKEERALVLRYDFSTRDAATAELARIRDAGGGWTRLQEILRGDHTFVGAVQLLSLSAQGIAEPAVAAALLDPVGASVTGPFELTGRWVIMDRLKLDPGRAMTGDEIHDDVERRIRQDRFEPARTAWIAQRRRDRAVTIDEKLLDGLSPGG
jgi:hypothetical protein